jgi:hypothetical protein
MLWGILNYRIFAASNRARLCDSLEVLFFFAAGPSGQFMNPNHAGIVHSGVLSNPEFVLK